MSPPTPVFVIVFTRLPESTVLARRIAGRSQLETRSGAALLRAEFPTLPSAGHAVMACLGGQVGGLSPTLRYTGAALSIYQTITNARCQ